MTDLRPSFESALDAFGVPVVVTADYVSTPTRGIWHSPDPDERPYGSDYSARDPRLAMSLPKSDVPKLNRGDVLSAPEEDGGATKEWQIDGFESTEWDHFRVYLKPRTDEV